MKIIFYYMKCKSSYLKKMVFGFAITKDLKNYGERLAFPLTCRDTSVNACALNLLKVSLNPRLLRFSANLREGRDLQVSMR